MGELKMRVVPLVLAGMFFAGVGAPILVTEMVFAQTTSSPFQVRSLVGATSEEIGQYAIDMMVGSKSVVSGMPEVALVRSVTMQDLATFVLPETDLGTPEPPLMLVILKGDFDLSRVPGADPQSSRFRYVASVFNLQTGFPVINTSSRKGGAFRKALEAPDSKTGKTLRKILKAQDIEDDPIDPTYLEELKKRPKAKPGESVPK